MEDYPASYVARPRPLLALSGFAAGTPGGADDVENQRPFRHGPRISSGRPLLDGDFANRLMQEFLAFDPGNLPTSADLRPMHFRMRPIGRVGKSCAVKIAVVKSSHMK